ncbi:hypothetical protein [Streptomyces gilvus]|uniref:hypothetical protein n=1 Tax=Streptomyces gilvus TaxID=2920937 RepID=UPI001F0D22CD|nr:hypothetical protein [Streptomyces sp. CME 23]MCH5676799.1 hypothetical protein [Streptomyces sp. CME 23]
MAKTVRTSTAATHAIEFKKKCPAVTSALVRGPLATLGAKWTPDGVVAVGIHLLLRRVVLFQKYDQILGNMNTIEVMRKPVAARPDNTAPRADAVWQQANTF